MPHIKSRLSYLLLIKTLKRLDVEHLSKKEELKKYSNFRMNYLNSILKRKGHLKCAYCGRKDLIPVHLTKHKLNNSTHNLATIDHIIPLSKNGEKYDLNNITVACRSCNTTKGNNLIIPDTNVLVPINEYEITYEIFNEIFITEQITLKAKSKNKVKKILRKELKKQNKDLHKIIKIV